MYILYIRKCLFVHSSWHILCGTSAHNSVFCIFNLLLVCLTSFPVHIEYVLCRDDRQESQTIENVRLRCNPCSLSEETISPPRGWSEIRSNQIPSRKLRKLTHRCSDEGGDSPYIWNIFGWRDCNILSFCLVFVCFCIFIHFYYLPVCLLLLFFIPRCCLSLCTCVPSSCLCVSVLSEPVHARVCLFTLRSFPGPWDFQNSSFVARFLGFLVF